MDSSRYMLAVAVFTVVSLRGALGALKCEELPMEVCAFSVSSTGVRCVLEKSIVRDGTAQYECLTSEVVAEKIYDWIETEVCLDACGLDRMQVGMSSDGLLESGFTRKLCSAQCYNSCPNIVNLYLNLAAGEGLHLPALCDAYRTGFRRMEGDAWSEEKTVITKVFAAHSFEFAAAPLSSDEINIKTSFSSFRIPDQLGNCWDCTCCVLIDCSFQGNCFECNCCELIDC